MVCISIYSYLPEQDSDFWNDKTGVNMTAREIEDWTIEGMLPNVGPASTLTTIQENCVQCARAEAEFIRWNEQIELKHAEIYRLRKYNTSFNSIWLTLAERWDSLKPGMAAYAHHKADMYRRRVANLDAEWKDVGVPELRNLPPGKTLADQVRARRESEISKYLPGYQYVLTTVCHLILMSCRFPIPKDTSFSSVEDLKAYCKGTKRAGSTEEPTGAKRKSI
jgi:hypothetical protein